MRKKITPYILAAGLYGIVIVLVFGRALLPGAGLPAGEAGEMIWGDDIHRAYYFYREFFNSFLRQGIWPWWNPYTFGGAPFIANPIVNIWYPPTWLFVLLPLNIAYSWHIALHILWAMIGMFVLLSSRGRSPWATDRGDLMEIASSKTPRNDNLAGPWIAGLVFGLSGFFAARIWAGHVDVIAAASWLPWVFGAFWHLNHDRWTNIRHGGYLSTLLNRRVVVAGGFFAMQILAGYQTMAFFTLEAVGLFTLFFCLLKRSAIPAIRAILAVSLGVGLAAIQIIPTQEFFRASIRTFDFPYAWNSYGSLTIESLKQFFNPFIFGDQLTYSGPPPNFAEHAFFVGRVGLVIGFLFLRSPRVFMFLLLALFGLWVSLGPHAPVDLQYILWKFVPMYKYLRIPARHLILVVFGLSGMVGMAMQYVNPKSEIRNPKQYQNSNVQNYKQFRILNFFRLEFVSNFVLRASNFLPQMFAFLITIEMILYARHFIALKPIPEARHDGELIKLLSPPMCRASFTSGVVPMDCLYRVLPNFGVWVSPRDSFDFDAGLQYRIFNTTGYDPSILRSYYEYIDIANGNVPGSSILTHDVQVPYLNVFSQATDFLNIKYILVPRAYDPLYGVKTDRFVLLREDVTRDYRLYENKSVKPRFFFENGTVMVKKYTPNEIVLSTDSKTGETLFSSEVFYPGWEGFVDGQKVDVIKTNHAFRSLFVPAGRHTVMYRYSPRIFLIGGIISAFTLIGCLVWLRR